MEKRKQGDTQEVAAAKSGFSIRSAKRIDNENLHHAKKVSKKTNQSNLDPLKDVWENDLVPLLENNPLLQAITLLRYLQERYPNKYSDSVLRTLQRRVRSWKGIHGPEKEVIFRQNHPPGWQALSDFTNCNELGVIIGNDRFLHLLYHFRLPFSGWEYAFVILGGESYPALAEGLQNALWALGGVPQTHRTDSLSAAYKNTSKKAQEDFTKSYQELCANYSMEPTRNNKGISHENGSIESSHRHLKSRLNQALMIRGSREFKSVEEYRQFVDDQVSRHNARIAHLVKEERKYLHPLPEHKTRDFDVNFVGVATTSIITVKQVRYSVPSNLIGHQLKVHIYDDHLECFLGTTCVASMKRKRWNGGKRPRLINYRHLIASLTRKPQAFRKYVFRDDLFPNHIFKTTWELLDSQLDDRSACREIVAILKLAAEHNEEVVSRCLEQLIASKTLPRSIKIEELFPRNKTEIKIEVINRDLKSYNQLLNI